MNKTRKSIDGFVLRPRSSNSDYNSSGKKLRHLDEAQPGIARRHIQTTDFTAQNTSESGKKSRNSAAFLTQQKINNSANSNSSKKIAKLDLATSPTEDEIQESLAATDDFFDQGENNARRKNPKRARKLAQHQKTPAARLKKKKIIKRVLLILFVLILILLAYFAWKFFDTGSKIFHGNPLAIMAKDQLKEDENGRTNVLIFGTSGYEMKESAWDGAFLTDSIMVLSVDQDAGDAYMVSLPRDLYVEHECGIMGTAAGKLNETYYCAYSDNNKNDKKGAEALMKTAGEILGLDIQYYVHANWTALVQAVNAVGGVTVKIESQDERGIYDVATELKLPNGEVNLDGEKALTLARARNSKGGYGLPNSNFDREIYQQKILNALQKKVLGLETLTNPVKINDLMSAAGDNLRTNIKTSEVRTIVDVAKKIGAGKIKSLPLTNLPDSENNLVTTGMVGSLSVVLPVAGQFDYSEIHAYLRRNIFASDMEKEAAAIDILNGSEQAGLAQEKADELAKDYYTIAKIGNFEQGLDAEVQIYQLNQEKTATAEALKKKFNIEIINGAPQNYSTNSDFVIIFGKN